MRQPALVIGAPVQIELIELPEQWGFMVDDRLCLIEEVLEDWAVEAHRCLSVRVHDGRRFMLRHDADTEEWVASACGAR